MNSLLFLLLWLLPPTARPLTVAADGTGDFTTIQAALNSLPATALRPRVVYIRNGTYREKVYLDGKSNLVLRGQSERGVVLTSSQARDLWHCDPAANHDDWGVATLNLRNCPDVTLENLTVLNTYGFEHRGQPPVAVPCAADGGQLKTVSATGHQMALRTLPGTVRLVVRHCTFRALGGDTVSPWDVDAGQYYFQDCTLEGGVDFYCPRGWAYAENCRFVCHNTSAAIWHDGSGSEQAKTVLRHCRFEGDPGFKLGRYHREAQFYLVDCRFGRNMADADIYQAASGTGAQRWGRRVYYANCHRRGGDYAWLRDNLTSAPGAPRPQDITPAWAFDNRWNPLTGAHAPDALPAAADSTAEKMLVYQRSNGGWPKAVHEQKVNYDHPLGAALRASTLADKDHSDATIDNNATTREIRYLVAATARTHNGAYQRAAERGVRYLLQMQQPSGGFPQYYPDSSLYRAQITYNDNAMVNALRVLQAVGARQNDYALLDASLAEPAQRAVARGVQCILRTQYVQRGRRTAWCAQHDRRTLLPCAARAFELPSLSGDETVGIVEFLMSLEQPPPAVQQAVAAAVAWLEAVQLPNLALEEVADPRQPSGRDHRLVPRPGAVLWARFYDLDTNQPFYVGRDGVKHPRLADIENERRVGYAYVGTWPAKLLAKDYPKWQAKLSGAPKP